MRPSLLEERAALLDDAAPGREVVVPMGAVAVFVRVLELVERGVLGVEQLAVPPEESLVDHVAPVRHARAPFCESLLSRSMVLRVPPTVSRLASVGHGLARATPSASATPKRPS